MNLSEKLKKSGLLSLIGNTPLIRINSLSELADRDIYIKCETANPGGTIKDRPALEMVKQAILSGELTQDKVIVEGTAGNTGIGLAMVGKALGIKVLVVLPKGQDPSKLRLLSLYGAEIFETDAVAYPDERHFFLMGKKLGTSDKNHWWVNQFDNPHNWGAHFRTTGPEIWAQTQGECDAVVCAAGSSGTIAGVSRYLKQMNPKITVHLVDPHGSGLCHYFHQKDWTPTGTLTMAEGVGITRMSQNWAHALVDSAFTLGDDYLVKLAYWLREKEGLVMGMSSMLNVAGAFYHSLRMPKKSKIVTFMCDGGDRALSKMYNPQYLIERQLDATLLTDKELRDYFSK
jgi:cysteine synthase A